jgi:hypothetical protein
VAAPARHQLLGRRNAAAPAAALAKKFPHAKISRRTLYRPRFVTIPYDGANVLAYRLHFYEFATAMTSVRARARNRQTLRRHHHDRRRLASL